LVGVGLHAPAVTCSCFPSTARPVTCGCAVETSSGFAGATGPTRLAYAALGPAASGAVTVGPIVFPMSFAPSARPGAVAPRIDAQCAPAAQQRYHGGADETAPP